MKKILISKKEIIYVIWVILYFFILNFMYKTVQVKIFSYVGYKLESNFFKNFIGWIIFLFGSFLFYSKKEKVSTIFYYVIYYLSISPFIILYIYNENVKLWMVIYQIFILFFIKMEVVFISKKEIKIKDNNIKINKNASKIFLIILSVFFMFIFYKNGISLENIFFENVYKTRMNNSFSLMENLLLILFCKIIIPLIIIDSVEEKRWGIFIYLVLIQIYFYLITGFKTFLFIPIILIGFKIMNKKSKNILVLKGLSFSLIISYIVYYFTNYIMAIALISNRVFFLPALIKYSYFDFFTNNKFLYFSETTIGKLFKIPLFYDKPMVFLIGEKYFNRPQMWTNTGFIADSFSQLGIIGGLIIGGIAIIEILIIDKVTKFSNSASSFPIFLLYFISLNDGSLISVSISGGMIVAIAICFFLTKND